MFEWIRQMLALAPELACLIGGTSAAFIMALLRSFHISRKSLWMCLVDSLMYAMLVAVVLIALGKGFQLYDLGWYFVIGTMLGYLGLNALHVVVLAGLKHFLRSYTSPETAASFEPEMRELSQILKENKLERLDPAAKKAEPSHKDNQNDPRP